MRKFYDVIRSWLVILFMMLMIPCLVYAQEKESDIEFDIMIDAGYHVSSLQHVRENLIQATYFLEQCDKDEIAIEQLLENSVTILPLMQRVSQEDKQSIQDLIDKINLLLATLESDKRSHFIDYCDQIAYQL